MNPPHSPEAERAVIGLALIAARECLAKLAEVQVDDFFLPEHRTIWEAIRKVEKDSGPDAVDPITVWDATQALGHSARVAGGSAGLMGFATAAPPPGQIEHHAKIVREKALLRKAIEFATDIQAAAYGGEGAKAILARIWSGAGKLETMGLLEEPVHIRDALGPATEVIEHRQRTGNRADIKTHISTFDQRLGGFSRDQLIVVASGPGEGKSAWAGGVARNVAVKSEIPVLIVSQEMGRQELVERTIAGQSTTALDMINMGQDWKAFHRAAGILEKAPLWFEDRPMTIEQIVGTAHRWHARNVAKPGVDNPLAMIVVDYIQIIQVAAKTERREREVGLISRSLKMLAKQLHCPVIAISSLNREGRKNATVPTLADLRESGAIEYDADMVLFLHRPQAGEDPDARNQSGPADLICAKNRGGRVGLVPLHWQAEWTTFTADAGQEPDDRPPITRRDWNE